MGLLFHAAKLGGLERDAWRISAHPQASFQQSFDFIDHCPRPGQGAGRLSPSALMVGMTDSWQDGVLHCGRLKHCHSVNTSIGNSCSVSRHWDEQQQPFHVLEFRVTLVIIGHQVPTCKYCSQEQVGLCRPESLSKDVVPSHACSAQACG